MVVREAGSARADRASAQRRGARVTARNRELVGLVLAAVIAGVALASVTIAHDAGVSARAATYGALFLGLYLAAHVAVRRTVPDADGALLPLTAVLTAFGLTLNYRLDPDDGGRQALWVLIGVGVLVATLVALRYDYRVLVNVGPGAGQTVFHLHWHVLGGKVDSARVAQALSVEAG